jgi:hypothetical protein
MCKITKALCTDPYFGAQQGVDVERSWALLPENPPVTNFSGSINVGFPNGSSIVSHGPIDVSGLRTLSSPPGDALLSNPHTWLASGGQGSFPTAGQDSYGDQHQKPDQPSWAMNKQ